MTNFGIFFVILLILVNLIALAFWVALLVDCLRYERDKLVWVIVMVFVPLVGSLLYFFMRVGKNRHERTRRMHRPMPMQPNVKGPPA